MDIEKIISEMTLEEKAGFCTGRDFWHTKAVTQIRHKKGNTILLLMFPYI